MDNSVKIILAAVLALLVGAAGGYFLGSGPAAEKGYTNGFVEGKSVGLKEGTAAGRQAVLDEQQKEADEALSALQEAANPFSDDSDSAVNPFEDTYTNPFAQ